MRAPALESPPSFDRALPYLLARDPSTKVVVSVSRDGSHCRAMGKGATLGTTLVPAHAPRKDPRDRPWPRREGAGRRPPVPHGREVTFPLGCSEPFPSWETLVGSSCCHSSPQASSQRRRRATGCGAGGRRATASGHFAPLAASPLRCRARGGRARLGTDPCTLQWEDLLAERRGGEGEPGSVGQPVPLVHPFSRAQRL